MEIPGGSVPSMNASSLSQLIAWKRSKAGTPLLNSAKLPVLDLLGNPILCMGGWNDPKIVQSFISILRLVHVATENNGDYVEPCRVCWSIRHPVDGSPPAYHPCPSHSTQHLYRMGNTADAVVVQNTYSESTEAGKSHKVRGDDALTPWEFNDLRSYWTGPGCTIYHFMLWVFALLSVKLAWRAMEGLTADGDYFDEAWELSQVDKDGVVDSLAVCFVV
jgi:hypothetical protein